MNEQAKAWLKANEGFRPSATPKSILEKHVQTGISILKSLPAANGFVASYRSFPIAMQLSVMAGFMRQVPAAVSAPKPEPRKPISILPVETTRKKATSTKAQSAFQSEMPADAQANLLPSPPPGQVRHLDQYLHLLPQELQNRAATIRQEYTLLTEYKNRLNQLFYDEHSTQQQRHEMADLLCHQDDKVRNFWQMVDAELSRHTGRPVSDEDRAALEQQAQEIAKREERSDGDWTYDELQEQMAMAATPEEKAQVEYRMKMRIENRKKYIRKPILNTPDHDVKVRMAVRELQQFGVTLSPKIRKIALQCGMKEEEL